MNRFGSGIALCVALASFHPSAVHAGPYDSPAQRAAAWLGTQMVFPDGSLGATDDVKYLQTSEVVEALRAYDGRTPGYYAAITWLQNNFPANADYRARRVLALAANGGSVSGDLSYLGTVEQAVGPGVTVFGLSTAYLGSPLDTAMALQAYQQASLAEDGTAVTYLKSAQLSGSDAGWPVGQESVSDPATTAQVLIALLGYRATDSSLATPIANGLLALNAKVNTSSAAHLKALSVLANLRNSLSSSQATTLLTNLVSTQASDGSWNEDVYATALALRAFAAALGRDTATADQAVVIDDPNLRAAINRALGRSALDALNQGELGQLTSLNIASQGINDLNGLQFARNLTFLDARNNNISSFAPVAGLTGATILEDGNPGAPSGGGGGGGDGPTLPEWGAILLGMLLLWLAHTRAGHPLFESALGRDKGVLP